MYTNNCAHYVLHINVYIRKSLIKNLAKKNQETMGHRISTKT